MAKIAAANNLAAQRRHRGIGGIWRGGSAHESLRHQWRGANGAAKSSGSRWRKRRNSSKKIISGVNQRHGENNENARRRNSVSVKNVSKAASKINRQGNGGVKMASYRNAGIANENAAKGSGMAA